MTDSGYHDAMPHARLNMIDAGIGYVEQQATILKSTTDVLLELAGDLMIDIVRRDQQVFGEVEENLTRKIAARTASQLEHLKRLGEAAEAALFAEYGESFIELGTEGRPGSSDTDQAE